MAVLEFVLVVPFFLFMVFGMVTYGVMLAEKQKITSTAADAARAAVGTTPGTEVTAAMDRIKAILGTPGTTYTVGPDTSVPGGRPQVAACPAPEIVYQCITVKIYYEYGSHPIMPSLNIPAPNGKQLHLFTPDRITSTAVIRLS